MNTGGLVAPADVQTIDEGGIARSIHGSQSSAPTWGVGDPVATALSGLSGMVDKYAKAYDDVVVNDYTMQKSKELDELYNNPDTGIFNTLKGDKAKGAYQNYKNVIRDMWDHDAMDNLTERQRDMASKHLYTLFSSYGHRVAEFETKQLMGAQVDRCKNAVQNAIDLMATGHATADDMANAFNAIKIGYATMGEMQGWDAETVERNQREAISEGITKGSAALAVADPLAAMGMLNYYQEMMLPAAHAAAAQSLDHPVKDAKKQLIYQQAEQGNMEGAAKLLRDNTSGAGLWISPAKPRKIALPQNVDAKIEQTANAEGVDPLLARAIAMQESGGRQSVRSNKGAVGVMQVIPKYVKDFGGGNPYNEDDNIRIGIREIKSYLKQFNGNLEHALIAYNWGPGNLKAWLKTGKGVNGQPMPEETRKYIPSVMAMMGRAPGQISEPYRPTPGMFKPVEADNIQRNVQALFDKKCVNDAAEVLRGMDRHEARQRLMTAEGQKSLGLNSEQAAMLWPKMDRYWKSIGTQEVLAGVNETFRTVKDMPLDKRDEKAFSLLQSRFSDPQEQVAALSQYKKMAKQEDDMQLAASWDKLKPIITDGLKQGKTMQQIYLDVMSKPDDYNDYDRKVIDKIVASPKNNSVSQAHVGRIKRGANAMIQEGKETQEILKWAEEQGFGVVTAAQAQDIQRYIEKGGVVSGVTLARCERLYKRLAGTKGKKGLDDQAYNFILDNLDPNETFYSDEKLSQIIADLLINEQQNDNSIFPNSLFKRTPYEAMKAGELDKVLWANEEEVQREKDAYKRRTGLEANDKTVRQDLTKKHVKEGWRVKNAR